MTPLSLLPAPEPRTVSPPPGYFYNNVSKWLIPDIIKIMANGIPINMSRVKDLENTVDKVLSEVSTTLATNKYVKQYLAQRRTNQKAKLVDEVLAKLKEPADFIKPYKPDNMTHRSYYVRELIGVVETGSYAAPGVPKWSINDLKKYSIISEVDLTPVINKQPDPIIANKAMLAIATDRANVANKANRTKLRYPDAFVPIEQFNPASPDQKHELLTGLLGLQSDKLTDAYIKYQREYDRYWRQGQDVNVLTIPKNKYSWNRDNIEKQLDLTTDPDLQSLLQALVDFSYSAIIKNNFIKSFYEYTIDGVLYGKLNLFGTKTFRLTGNSPNLLQLPSTGSRFSKPVKKCFIAPKGWVIYAIDYGALENRIIANLSRDTNLSNIYLQGLDGHCMNSLYYFKEEIAKHIDLTGDAVEDAKAYYEAVELGNAELKAIRQKGKAPSFGMQYGAYPTKVAESIKCTIEEAEQIFNRYHNELYPGVTQYREEYVEPTVKATKKIHMGLGQYLHTDDPNKDIRTLVNSTSQFWSLLTLLAINDIHNKLPTSPYQDSIKCIATIYDSIYYTCKAEAPTIKWLNDTIVPSMCGDFMENQTVPLEATGEIGLNWADLTTLPNNASLEQIEEVLSSL